MSFLIQRVEGESEGDLQRTTRVQRLSTERLRIGRGAGTDLRLADPSLDMVHAVIRPLDERGWEVVDRGSVTGTYVNGRRVDRAELGEDDWIELGRHRLTVQLPASERMPLVVLVKELEEEIGRPAELLEGEGTLEAPELDYRAAYGLERRGLRTILSVLCAIGALGTLVVLFDQHELAAFRPGQVSEAHSGIADRCGACHRVWKGTIDALCVECHAAPEHQPRQVGEPSCGECHTEHRFLTELDRVPDERCVGCHSSIEIEASSRGRFAEQITDFAVDHPQFALDTRVPIEDEGAGVSERVPLEEAVEAGLDPTSLTFPHRKHLQPTLKSPRGPVRLDCFDCHEADGTGEIRPIAYEEQCRGCHPLTFDANRPPVPHADPEVVHAFLLRQYAEVDRPERSLPERRRLLPGRNRRSRPARLEIDERVLRKVVETEYNLYRASCDSCHEVDLEGILPAVEPARIPSDWFPYAEFAHEPHRMVECTTCHERAEESSTAKDVLLPGIRTCRNCHGPQRVRGASRGGATTACVSCHAYHDASRTGGWGTDRPGGTWEAETGLADERSGGN